MIADQMNMSELHLDFSFLSHSHEIRLAYQRWRYATGLIDTRYMIDGHGCRSALGEGQQPRSVGSL